MPARNGRATRSPGPAVRGQETDASPWPSCGTAPSKGQSSAESPDSHQLVSAGPDVTNGCERGAASRFVLEVAATPARPLVDVVARLRNTLVKANPRLERRALRKLQKSLSSPALACPICTDPGKLLPRPIPLADLAIPAPVPAMAPCRPTWPAAHASQCRAAHSPTGRPLSQAGSRLESGTNRAPRRTIKRRAPSGGVPALSQLRPESREPGSDHHDRNSSPPPPTAQVDPLGRRRIERALKWHMQLRERSRKSRLRGAQPAEPTEKARVGD